MEKILHDIINNGINFVHTLIFTEVRGHLKDRVVDDPEFENDVSIVIDLTKSTRLEHMQCMNYIDINRNIGGKSFLSCVTVFSGIKAAKQLLNYEELTNIFGLNPSPIDLISLQILFNCAQDNERLQLVEERILQHPKENFLHDFIHLIYFARDPQQIIQFYMIHNYSITISSSLPGDGPEYSPWKPHLESLMSEYFVHIGSDFKIRYCDEILKYN